MNFVFLVFGSTLSYHQQTYFAILTVLRHKRVGDTVIVYTDAPQYYARLGGTVDVVALDKHTIGSWIDGTGYIFRAKIKAIEDCVSRRDGHLLFMDSDTVLYGNIDDMEHLLVRGIGIMYVDEGHPSAMKGASLRMWKRMEGRRIGHCTISMRHNVWNSGVIGIPACKAKAVVDLALNVCDEILRSGAKCFTAEQYAFSVAMQEACELHPAVHWVGHYWGNKEDWTVLIRDFIVKSHITSRSLEDEIEAIGSLQLVDTPLHVKKSNTRRRLTNLIARAFPDKIVGK